MSKLIYVDVILPVPLKGTFTYSVPSQLIKTVEIGKRTIVQLGGKKLYSGIIKKIHNTSFDDYEIKDIIDVLDKNSVVTEGQIAFWEWISDYYMCTLGEVYKAALPSGLKLESETKVYLNAKFDGEVKLEPSEELIVNALKHENILSVGDISRVLNKTSALKELKQLIEKDVVHLKERIKDSYKPIYETFVKLQNSYCDDIALNELSSSLNRAQKQKELLYSFIEKAESLTSTLSKKSFVTTANQGALKALVKKGVFELIQVEKSRLHSQQKTLSQPKALNEKQQLAYDEIKQEFEEKDVALLHGVTSSGKTELYIKLIQETIEQGKQALYLLPEIALTSQIINRLGAVFGKRIGVYHSKFNDAERVEIWNNVLLDGGYDVVLGVRSSVFLPFKNLGVIIVDEEHENSYKQFDPAPRYNARDAAVVLGGMHKAKILLGTATPSFETYFNAVNGKYGFVKLMHRYRDIKMPETIVVDTLLARKRKRMKSYFSETLVNHIEQALNSKEQVILFQNRRGFSPYLECANCGHIPKCKFCDVSLTYHKFNNQLSCHYCGYAISNTPSCSSCGSAEYVTKGFGTEKIEDDMSILFPEARIQRMDLDTTRSKTAYERIIGDFEDGKVDVLVGTQMVTKGLDFDNVNLVGVLNADNMLNYPDFRAYERSFQLLSQVSGRAGRKNRQGLVIIQTTDVENMVIEDVVQNKYEQFYMNQIAEREMFKYPPFYRLIRITLKHKDKSRLNKASVLLAEDLRKTFGKRVLGPEFPVINRVQDNFIKIIVLKIERKSSFSKSKEVVQESFDKVFQHDDCKGLRIIPDVDPM